jgi:lipopolysaccharide export system protein LptA
MRNKLLQIATFVLSLSILPSFALPEDRDQPIYITADTASINDKTGITTYKGNVVITQGSMQIEAEHVDMYRGDEGIEKLIAKGQPAHFRQQPEKDAPYSDAWGLHMVYLIDTEKLTITQQAKVIQEQDTFTGEKIVYDLKRSIVDAFGNATDNTGNNSGRVNMVIQPKNKNPE